MHLGNMTIDEALRWYRQHNDLTRAEMASLLGMKKASYAHLEQPGANPTWKTMGPIFRLLNMSFVAEESCPTEPDHYHLISRGEANR